MTNQLQAIDLFCGSGGLSRGLQMADIDISIGLDYDKNAILTYDANHNSKGVQIDLREVNKEQFLSILSKRDLSVSDIDIVAGGPPCKGFSQANRQTGDVSNPHNHLYKHFLRIVEFVDPDVVIIENVPNFLRMEDGYFRDLVIEQLEDLEYNADSSVLMADNYGVPQQRERAFIIATRHGDPPFPSPEFSSDNPDYPDPPTVEDALFDLPELPTGGGGEDVMEYNSDPDNINSYVTELRKNANEDIILNHRSSNNRERTYRRFEHIPQGGNWKDIPPKLMQNYTNRSRTHDNIYHRLEEKEPAPTITNFRKQMVVHPTQDRLLSIREAARLQSFPDDYVFEANGICAMQQMVGNAVPVLLAEAIGSTVVDHLEKAKNTKINST